jgi:ribosome-associated toxin RatA of RatAB toxin-antitoxin module
MDTTNSLTIRGDLDSVYAYAAAVERWPEILPHYRRVNIIQPGSRERLVSMQCFRSFGPLKWPCKWRARQELRPEEGRILYSHVSGPARGMQVEWRLTQKPDGVETTIRHEHGADRYPWTRIYWNRIVGPIFVRPIADRTLAAIKELIEREVEQ